MSKSKSPKASQPYAQLNNVASLFALTRSAEPTTPATDVIDHKNNQDQTDQAEQARTDLPAYLKLQEIVLPAQQPRRYFDAEKLAQLTASIREHGILEPLLVRPKQGQYELVAGERRFRAAQEIGLAEVPVMVHQLDDRQALQVALIENLQREDLNAIEETEGILRMLELTLELSTEEVIMLFNWKARQQRTRPRGEHETADTSVHNADNETRWQAIETVFQVIGRFTPESFRTHRLPLLKLPESVMQAINSGKIEYSKARLIARIKDEDSREQLLIQAIEQGLSRQEISSQISLIETASRETSSIERQIQVQANSVIRKLRNTKLNGRSLEKVQQLLSQLEALLE
jgi:ParB family chromosome partitioning protein